ncbi:C-type lectin domain family 3 member A [Protopterus annectens]|uniref:C-type lectin domain family 3 member A n=1 Tax=Protopterus annectens TaxID=7888 RepID=UPI001CF9EB42|nr:C-type lectin domain family 3 member A [Protopterus annectens]
MALNRVIIFVFALLVLLLDETEGQSARSKPDRNKVKHVRGDDDDLKTQIEKLWKEVNSLKEMQALQTVCLRGTKIHKKCYLAIEEAKHFHEANEDCIAQGGTLATPRNSDENDALMKYGKISIPEASEWWLGITDMVNEGKFVDVNGIAVSFLNWDRSTKQPDGGKRENCAMVSQKAQGKWKDEVCRDAKKYICEFLIP